MGKIMNEVSVKLTKTLDKEIAVAMSEQIDNDVEDILASLSKKSFIYLGELDADD